MASFPSSIKTFPTLVDYVDNVLALHQNERGDEISAIENTLGINPQGAYASVVARLNATQPLDSDLTSIAGLSPANDDVIQRKAGAWSNRTIAQLTTDVRTILDSIYSSIDGWIGVTGTWTPFSQSYTNDPASGSNIVLNMTNTVGFKVGDAVTVSSSAGTENTTITVVVANTSVTVASLALNHTTTSRLIKLASTNMTFVIQTSVSLVSVVQVGFRIKCTNSSVKYFIVVAITATEITAYGGTDYSIDASSAVTNLYYSPAKCPYGFPSDPEKWTIITKTTTDPTPQASPTAGNLYNVGSYNIVVPIGKWRLGFTGVLSCSIAASQVSMQGGLSTSGASFSDKELVGYQVGYASTVGRALLIAERKIDVSAKTTYTLYASTGTAGVTSIGWLGSIVTTKTFAECSLL